VNAVRFTTQDLREFESKVTNAESLLYEREYNLFKDISKEILNSFKEIKEVSNNISNIDFISNLSFIAYENNYIKPEITNNFEINIKEGRHPVIEKIEKKFISNDLFLNEKKFTNIITGPNM
jgi:DNA mismatch repair protein MutS